MPPKWWLLPCRQFSFCYTSRFSIFFLYIYARIQMVEKKENHPHEAHLMIPRLFTITIPYYPILNRLGAFSSCPKYIFLKRARLYPDISSKCQLVHRVGRSRRSGRNHTLFQFLHYHFLLAIFFFFSRMKSFFSMSRGKESFFILWFPINSLKTR